MLDKKVFIQIAILFFSTLIFAIILVWNLKNSFNIQQIELDQSSQSIISEEFFKTKFNTSGLSAFAKRIDTGEIFQLDYIQGTLKEKLMEIFKPYQTCIKTARERLDQKGIKAEFGISSNYFHLYRGEESFPVIGKGAVISELKLFGDLEDLIPDNLKTRFHHKSVDMSYYFRINSYVSITNQKAYIIGRLKGLIISNILGFLILVCFLIYISHSIISQKKISDMKDDFINNITHELNTPLTTIDMAIETIGKVREGNDRVLLLETVKRQNQRLRNIVKKIMQISFYDREGVFLNRSNRSVNQLVENICSDFRVKYIESVNLEVSLEAEQDCISLDPFHFESAMSNLLVNAVKYSGENAKIKIRTFNDDSSLVIEISDRGTGIPFKYHKKVFNKFFRLRSLENQAKPGLGLGLNLVNRIIRAHQGFITLKNNSGGGTIISMILPVK